MCLLIFFCRYDAPGSFSWPCDTDQYQLVRRTIVSPANQILRNLVSQNIFELSILETLSTSAQFGVVSVGPRGYRTGRLPVPGSYEA
jgi:hypothetical protein